MTLALATPGAAAPISFDCDVPSDHFSSVTQEGRAPFEIRGTFTVRATRSGDYLPLAGVRVASDDGQAGAGFQIAAPSADAKQFDIFLNLQQNSNLRRTRVGQLALDDTTIVAFDLTLSDTGKVALHVGDQTYAGETGPIQAGTLMLFCSTGQFKFFDVMFGADAATKTASPP